MNKVQLIKSEEKKSMCSNGTNENKPRGDGVVLVDAFFWLIILIWQNGNTSQK